MKALVPVAPMMSNFRIQLNVFPDHSISDLARETFLSTASALRMIATSLHALERTSGQTRAEGRASRNAQMDAKARLGQSCVFFGVLCVFFALVR